MSKAVKFASVLRLIDSTMAFTMKHVVDSFVRSHPQTLFLAPAGIENWATDSASRVTQFPETLPAV